MMCLLFQNSEKSPYQNLLRILQLLSSVNQIVIYFHHSYVYVATKAQRLEFLVLCMCSQSCISVKVYMPLSFGQRLYIRIFRRLVYLLTITFMSPVFVVSSKWGFIGIVFTILLVRPVFQRNRGSRSLNNFWKLIVKWLLWKLTVELLFTKFSYRRSVLRQQKHS